MNKKLKVLVFLTIMISLVSCSGDEESTDKNIDKYEQRINKLEEEICLLKDKIQRINTQDNQKYIEKEIYKFEEIINELPDVDVKLGYINNIEKNSTVKFKVDFIKWLVDDGDEFPNGFKILNTEKDTKELYISSDKCVYTLDSDGLNSKKLNDFVNNYNKEKKQLFKLYIINDGIVFIEEQYIP